MKTPRPRLRIRRTTWPRHALILAETPRPDCPRCEGDGGTAHDYGDYETGEYAGTDWDPCICWNENHRWTLLPLPRLPRYSNEPPF
ncbi:hypothetical protein B7755_023560 [Streptomyces sp. NBS 14/10]|uniref:hypothetical protein n=1 Tax=Streptomyces sp. NBS 14/10 TaxID=1945643 RepID=UPI000B7DFA16|nr:hypothetical protein [Streptomyces sp. NBS 14/10]KAK1180859.1 hypothetical protein B7755_023560 [Streptomyces sp. NBS 14/10]